MHESKPDCSVSIYYICSMWACKIYYAVCGGGVVRVLGGAVQDTQVVDPFNCQVAIGNWQLAIALLVARVGQNKQNMTTPTPTHGHSVHTGLPLLVCNFGFKYLFIRCFLHRRQSWILMNLIEKVGAVAKQTDVRLPASLSFPLSRSLSLPEFLSLSHLWTTIMFQLRPSTPPAKAEINFQNYDKYLKCCG